MLSCARLLATPWIAAYQAPPSMRFSRQAYWSGVPQQRNPKHSSPVSSGAILRAVEQKLPLKLPSLRKSQRFKKLFVEPVVWSPLPSARRSSWRKFPDRGSEPHPRRWKSSASVRGPGGRGKCLCRRPHIRAPRPLPPPLPSMPHQLPFGRKERGWGPKTQEPDPRPECAFLR